jgi:hypothetical protein
MHIGAVDHGVGVAKALADYGLIQNRAMTITTQERVSNSLNDKGGIDFNADKLNLQIQNAGEGIKFHLPPAMLEQLRNSAGFTVKSIAKCLEL